MPPRPSSRFLFFVICLSFVLAPATFAASSDAAALSSATPSPAMSGIPEKISKEEVRRIRRTFVESLDVERETLIREQNRRKRESDADRKSRKQEWIARENAGRKKFFEENEHGAERRRYVKELTERRIDFLAALKKEEKDQSQELEVRRKSLQEDQRMRLNEVEAYLKRNERPPNSALRSTY